MLDDRQPGKDGNFGNFLCKNFNRWRKLPANTHLRYLTLTAIIFFFILERARLPPHGEQPILNLVRRVGVGFDIIFNVLHWFSVGTVDTLVIKKLEPLLRVCGGCAVFLEHLCGRGLSVVDSPLWHDTPKLFHLLVLQLGQLFNVLVHTINVHIPASD